MMTIAGNYEDTFPAILPFTRWKRRGDKDEDQDAGTGSKGNTDIRTAWI